MAYQYQFPKSFGYNQAANAWMKDSVRNRVNISPQMQRADTNKDGKASFQEMQVRMKAYNVYTDSRWSSWTPQQQESRKAATIAMNYATSLSEKAPLNVRA
jgi:hypothetical protein